MITKGLINRSNRYLDDNERSDESITCNHFVFRLCDWRYICKYGLYCKLLLQERRRRWNWSLSTRTPFEIYVRILYFGTFKWKTIEDWIGYWIHRVTDLNIRLKPWNVLWVLVRFWVDPAISAYMSDKSSKGLPGPKFFIDSFWYWTKSVYKKFKFIELYLLLIRSECTFENLV